MFIYKIENKITKKCYIGKTENHDVNIRWKQHRTLLDNNKHFNSHLQKSWNKYQPDSFTFEVIEEVKPEHQPKIGLLELFYIVSFASHSPTKGYNKTFGGEGVIPTQETRNKLKKSRSTRVISEETKLKQSKVMSERWKTGSSGLGRKRNLNNVVETQRKTFELPIDVIEQFMNIVKRDDLKVKDAAAEAFQDWLKKKG